MFETANKPGTHVSSESGNYTLDEEHEFRQVFLWKSKYLVCAILQIE